MDGGGSNQESYDHMQTPWSGFPIISISFGSSEVFEAYQAEQTRGLVVFTIVRWSGLLWNSSLGNWFFLKPKTTKNQKQFFLHPW